MVDYYSLPEGELPMSMRYLRKILKERGWKAEKLCREGQNNLVLTRPDRKVIKIASSAPPTTSVYALRLADDKLMSYELLKELGVSQPETVVARTAEDCAEMLGRYGEIVIKPVDGAHGRGVTTMIRSITEVEEAIRKAKKASAGAGLAIAQPQLPSEALERRVICIGYKFVVAIARIPAQVTGDGVRTLEELIALENETIRTAPYQGRLAWINTEMAKQYLGARVDEVPAAGEKVRVTGTCNVGQGGTALDCSDSFSAEERELAEQIARAAELPVVGIDFYGDQVIELNACPSLYYPTGDEAEAKAAEAYVEYLASI